MLWLLLLPIALVWFLSPAGLVLLYFRVRGLERRLERAEAGLVGREAATARAEAPTAETPAPEPEAPAPGAEPLRPPEPEPAPAPVPPGPSRHAAIEEAITARWMVWLGGVALALAAVFLFRFAIEQGWLGPRARIGMGLLLGLGLVAAGHRAGQGLRPGHVGPTLTAAGLFALYASLYAGQALYHLYGSAAAFVGLALVSAAGLVLARRHGPVVALLGIAGGYLIPALLPSDAPQAAPVFGFLVALTAGALALLSVRPWRFLDAAAIAGSLGWVVLWLAGPWTPADQGVLSAYGIAVAGLFGLFRPAGGSGDWRARTSELGFALAGAALILTAAAAGWNPAAFAVLGLYGVTGLALARRHPATEALAAIAAAMVLAAVLAWPAPPSVSLPAELQRLGVESLRTVWGPVVLPPEFVAFARALAGYALLFGLGGFLALGRVSRPGLWSGLSAGMPVALFVIGYWRIDAFGIDIRWSAFAVGLAVAGLAAATASARRLPPGDRELPIGLYAAAMSAALALAFACLLREAWLTVVLAVQVTALAWIWSWLRLPALRAIAAAVAIAVILRLVLNWNILDYGGSIAGVAGWVLYGYGLPALAFFAAARLLRDGPPDGLVALCETAAAAFLFLMVALQLRLWSAGSLDAPAYGLFDMAMQTAWWLIAAAFLLRRGLAESRPAARWGGLGLLGLATAQLVLGHLLVASPLYHPEPVGSLPVLNLLGLAYLLPALLLGVLGTHPGLAVPARLRRPLQFGAVGLGFLWISLEVRRAFQGSVIAIGPGRPASVAEVYAYSLAWLAAALALLAGGILRGSTALRGAALAVLLATALKVFLYDTSDLTGLWRVASFLGLGLALIGIGQLYRAFVFRR